MEATRHAGPAAAVTSEGRIDHGPACRSGRRSCKPHDAVQTDERPLPTSLTRLLAATSSARLPPTERGLPAQDRAPGHAALESALLRGFVYGVSGLVWLIVMLLIVRHIVR